MVAPNDPNTTINARLLANRNVRAEQETSSFLLAKEEGVCGNTAYDADPTANESAFDTDTSLSTRERENLEDEEIMNPLVALEENEKKKPNIDLSKNNRKSVGPTVAACVLFLLFGVYLSRTKTLSQQPLSSGSQLTRDPFSTSLSAWTPEQVQEFEYCSTPESYTPIVYHEREQDQGFAEMANTEEEVRYISNVADIMAQALPYQYQLLVLVFVRHEASLAQTKHRWDAILDQFIVPSFVQVRVEFVIRRTGLLFEVPKEPTDWVFLVQESTYVHLSRLVHRLFADVDPTTMARQGLLTSIDGSVVPLLAAGILFTQRALADVWDNPLTSACWDSKSISSWCTCLSKASINWTSLPGLNPLNVRNMMRQSLEGSLFASNLYESVGGPVVGTARLPLTYGEMTEDLFYDQLAVDTHQGQIPKILHHIWSGPKENMNDEVREAAKQCQQMHEEQGWQYMFWDDPKLQALPGLPRMPSMKDIKLVRHYTDVVRYYLLHQFGGVYIDMDAYCIRPFDPLIAYAQERKMDFLVNYESQRHRGRQIANGILLSAPASPVMSAIILHLGNKLIPFRKRKNKKQAYKVTGPWCLTEVRDQWESWMQSHLIVLSSTAFIPLYHDEGKEFDHLNDLFDLARRQGSYTIQMYHHGSLKVLIDKEMGVKHVVKDEGDKMEGATNFALEGTQSNRPNGAEPSVLMIVAHPDDEIIWGGEYLLKEGRRVHVVVTSTQNKETTTRHEEFSAMEKLLGFQGEFLNGTDSPKLTTLEGPIQSRIQQLVCGRDWQRVITHGYEGEYGHPQHQQVFDAVVDAVRFCCHSTERLFVFEPHPSEHQWPRKKIAAAQLYGSQEKVLRKFGKWQENIVRLVDYDFDRASKDCAEGALTRHKTRKCRIRAANSSSDVLSPIISGGFEGRGSGC